MKWDGMFASTALLGVSSIQAMVIGNIILALSYILDFKTPTLGKIIGIGVGLLILLFSLLNWLYYRNKYEFLVEKFENEPKIKKVINGIFVILALASQWVIVILFGVFQ
jgi:hypothetical protein